MPCSLGVDLSQGDDFCAFTFLFPLADGTFGVKTRSYITEITFNSLSSALRFKYESFRQEGSLQIFDSTVLDMMDVYEDLDRFIQEMEYMVLCLGYDPYNAKEFINRYSSENSAFGIEKVIQGARTESVPLGELKKLSEHRMLIFDETLMSYTLGNAITMQDTNGNRKLLKRRHEEKIDNVSGLLDAWVAYKLNREQFD
jgi:phage terminase large subunit-like protein